jgi:hypothetical protein
MRVDGRIVQPPSLNNTLNSLRAHTMTWAGSISSTLHATVGCMQSPSPLIPEPHRNQPTDLEAPVGPKRCRDPRHIATVLGEGGAELRGDEGLGHAPHKGQDEETQHC